MSSRIFISYASQDKEVANILRRGLEACGNMCWMAPDDVDQSLPMAEQIVDAINKCQVIIIVISKHANKSELVSREASIGISKAKPVLPVRVEDVILSGSLEYLMSSRHWIDAFPRPIVDYIPQLNDSIYILTSDVGISASASCENASPIPKNKDKKRSFWHGLRHQKQEMVQCRNCHQMTPLALAQCEKCGADLWSLDRGRKLAKSLDKVAEPVHFTVVSPPAVLTGAPFIVDVWAHTAAQRREVAERAKEATPGKTLALKTQGSQNIPIGCSVTVRLEFSNLDVEEPEVRFPWLGDITSVSFAVIAPKKVIVGSQAGCVSIYVSGLRISRIHFLVEVGDKTSPVAELPTREERTRTAFASYASQDRNQVLARIQGIQKAVPNMDIFLDVLNLRSGTTWEQELWKEIPARDIFYLFWSSAAKESEWVEKEWRCALQAKGLDFIDPVPLESPDKVAPPPELAGKHFNDWILAFMRAETS